MEFLDEDRDGNFWNRKGDELKAATGIMFQHRTMEIIDTIAVNFEVVILSISLL